MLVLSLRSARSRKKTPCKRWHDESPSERRHRQQQAKADRISAKQKRTDALLEADDRTGLFNEWQGLVRYYAYKMQQAFDFDDHMKDDLIQAGSIGLWDASEKYQPGPAKFSSFATKCIRRKMWREFNRLKQQARLKFPEMVADSPTPLSEKPSVDDQLAETELIGVIMRKLEELPEDARLILKRKCDGDHPNDIAADLGVSHATVYRKFNWAVERMEEITFPVIAGAWNWPYLVRDYWADLEAIQNELSKPRKAKDARFCVHCGEEIHGRNKKAKFCTKLCQAAANNEKNNALRKERDAARKKAA